MKFDNPFVVLGIVSPIVTLAQDTVTVRMNTGICAASYATENPTGGGNGGAGREGVSSEPGLSTALSNEISSTSTDVSLRSASTSYPFATANSSSASESLSSAPSATTSSISDVNSPGSAAVTSSAASPSASVIMSSFLLRYSEAVPAAMRPYSRRESSIFSGYATASGQTSINCHDSMVYSLSDSGILSAGGGTVFSTSPGTQYQRFNASTEIENIYAVWQVSDQTAMWNNSLFKTLVWNNRLFANNTATFCVIHGVVRIYFSFPLLPDCMPVSLAILPLSSCTYRLPPKEHPSVLRHR